MRLSTATVFAIAALAGAEDGTGADGLTRLPLSRFVIADAIYAVPGVSLLFFLGWWLGSSVVDFINNEVKVIKIILFAVVLLGGVTYLFWYLRRKAASPDVIQELEKPVPPPDPAPAPAPVDAPPAP